MDKRSEPRFESSQPVSVTLLGDSNQILACKMTNVSGNGMQLLTAQPVPVGSAVRVDWEDLLVLGEVVYCREHPDGGYASGLRLDEALTNLDELARLSLKLLGSPIPATREEVSRRQ